MIQTGIGGTATSFNATNAYKVAQKMLDQAGSTNAGGSGEAGRSAFSELVSSAASSTIGNVRKVEQVAGDAVLGKASLNEVVNAVTSAEIALKSVIAIRDKVIMAYQDIIKMPI
jgi:flagellar hook-basal body complex protein FliE